MEELKSRHLFSLSLDFCPTLELGRAPFGERRVVPVARGRFSGERLCGEVLQEAGADLLLTLADGTFRQDARVVLRTNDDALILMSYRGVRHGSPEVNSRIARGESVSQSEYYLRTAPFFETGARNYEWLNRILAVGVGARLARGVLFEVFEIL